MEGRTRYDEKLARILKEAARLFAEKGYHQASVRDIAGVTGVSLSGLYYYFKSKEELLFLIQRHCFETIVQKLDESLDGVDDPVQRLRVVIHNHLGFFLNNMPEMKVLSYEADALSGDYRDRVTTLKRRYTEKVRRILRALSPELGVDLRVATFTLFGMMNWIYTWYRPGRDPKAEELAEQMLHLFLSGFTAARDGAAPLIPEVLQNGETSIWRSS